MQNRVEKILISIKGRDYGDKVRNDEVINVNKKDIEELKALGFYREITQVKL